MKMRFYLSLFIAKFLYLILKITKLSSGTAILGLITLKICPDFLIFANDYIGNTKINITGTNGKTTTSGIITHLIKKTGAKIINNTSGANMLNGIVNALALQINPIKKVDFSVIETDEAFLEKVYSKTRGNYLLVTNLFEDQTDRFANPLVTKSLIQKGIDKNPEVQLILNADEPISASLKSNKTPIFYGFENIYDENGNTLKSEAIKFNCPICEKTLEYSKNFYSQVGQYQCSCGYKRQDTKYNANVFLFKNHSRIELEGESFEIPLVGLYNAYNALGAIVLAKEIGLIDLQDNLKTFRVAFGRSEKRSLYKHNVLIQLIKNPTGTNEILKTVDIDSHILIAMNNNEADGKDISWINDANFEKLSAATKEIVVTGLCAQDIANRLHNVGVKQVKVIQDIKKAVNYIGKNADSDVTILTTYTALLKIDKIKEMKKCY